MIELIKKAMFTGIGVATLTKEKIEELAGEFVEKGKLSEQEGQKFVDDVLAKSEETKADISRQIEEGIEKAIGKLNLARSSEVEELKKEIDELKMAMTKANEQ